MSPKKLAKNTAALFMRQIIILAINLYSISALLKSLGVDDFALFNVLSSAVLIGSFVTGSLSTVTQRYFSVAIGEKSLQNAKRAHDTGFALCAAALLSALIVLQIAGTWFVLEQLEAPSYRIDYALIAFHLIALSFFVNGFGVFYSSITIAHEDMNAFAFISVTEAMLRLVAVLAIALISADSLITYGAMLLAVSLIVTAIYWLYCARCYPECGRGRFEFDINTLRHMVGFAGWTVFGQFTTMSRTHAVTILINQAFSPATVAARALAASISAQVLTFSTNFSSALHPPVIKAHASGEKEQMYAMVFTGSKITFFLVWIATLPFMIAMPGILQLWLGTYPAETTLFARLGLIENAIMAISIPLMTAVRATGQMRLYELSLGGLQLLVLLFSWLLVRAGYPAYSVYIVAIAVNLAMFGVRLAIAGRLTGLPVAAYLTRVLLPVMIVVTVSSGLSLAILHMVPSIVDLSPNPYALGALAVICLIPPCVIYGLGLSGSERRTLHAMVGARLAKLGARA